MSDGCVAADVIVSDTVVATVSEGNSLGIEALLRLTAMTTSSMAAQASVTTMVMRKRLLPLMARYGG